ncbi:hypothetical protein [Frigoriglobus tundricola]|uniref:DNA primase n=1 Tax=Frigoriglobus tundricola TaxID=2774151 RepID=A0A6M5YNT3_9BACT|nr:hypothetical protein [Frigoriglobus tundricola]QJW95618.1 hypothetical protein FTUN_3169 [Frigoriglobus tundricola]
MNVPARAGLPANSPAADSDAITLDPPRPVPGKPGVFTFVSRTDEPLHTDEFRPSVASRVTKFVHETLRKAYPALKEGEWPVGVAARLEKQFIAWAISPPESPKQPSGSSPDAADPRDAALDRMPKDICILAEGYLENPMMIERISADIQDAGVVGERELALALYLVGSSAQLPEPLAAVVRGPSSSGKSFLVETVASFFPPEVTLKATDLSPNALYYFPPGELRHRWVVAGERSRMENDERAEATRALREMISAGRLSKAVAVKEADTIVSRLIVQEGPIAFVETTTLEDIFAEDANRCLIFNTDERDEQTRRILSATASRAAGKVQNQPARCRAIHYAIQRMLPRTNVVIPFAPDLAALLPASRVEERRDLSKVLRFIRASALLHHRRREEDIDGHVVATLADYQLALRLAACGLDAARSGLSDPARRCFEVLCDRFGRNEFDSIAAETAAAKSRSSVRAWLSALAQRGFVEQTELNKGPNPARWRLTGQEPESAASYLPPVEKVKDKYLSRKGSDTKS